MIGSNFSLLQSQNDPSSFDPSVFLSSPSFTGGRSAVSFYVVDDVNDGSKSFDLGEFEGDDECFQNQKKRRLSRENMEFLERSFELENRLEPERKIQLATELDLEPKQVAIWFQNRRARWKTKQMEKDYEALQSSYNDLMADFECIRHENEKLKAQILGLKEKQRCV